MWPFKKQPVEVPPAPRSFPAIWTYLDETIQMIDAQKQRIGNPLKWREFNYWHRVIEARHHEIEAALSEME